MTPDQAYAGVANGLYMANVKYILDSIVVALLKNPDRKMIYNEQGFFTRWWREQTDGTKATVRSLVAEGRLQMINGGWAQHDEGSSSDCSGGLPQLVHSTGTGDSLCITNGFSIFFCISTLVLSVFDLFVVVYHTANPNFLEMLDNTAVGQRAIVDMFNEAALPNVTWQIGASSDDGV